jgi:hypothetical protein
LAGVSGLDVANFSALDAMLVTTRREQAEIT